MTAQQQATVEAGLKNGAVNLGLKLNIGAICSPGINESISCPVRPTSIAHNRCLLAATGRQ